MNNQDFTKKAAANAIKNIGRTPQDKINRHVAFALNNSKPGRMPANTLSLEVLQTLANWYKKLQHLNTLPLDNENWQTGLCKNSLKLAGQEEDINVLFDIRESLFKCWPKYSGNSIFPIPGESRSAYIIPTTDYKQLRKELSLHCIAELEKLLIPQYFSGNLSLEDRIKVLKLLKKLYRLPVENEEWETGLCYIAARPIADIHTLLDYLSQYFKTWKYFSGRSHDPISKYLEINKTKSRKQLRKNLCGHVIKSIEAELKYVL